MMGDIDEAQGKKTCYDIAQSVYDVLRFTCVLPEKLYVGAFPDNR